VIADRADEGVVAQAAGEGHYHSRTSDRFRDCSGASNAGNHPINSWRRGKSHKPIIVDQPEENLDSRTATAT